MVLGALALYKFKVFHKNVLNRILRILSSLRYGEISQMKIGTLSRTTKQTGGWMVMETTECVAMLLVQENVHLAMCAWPAMDLIQTMGTNR